jgi:hypothetical protein
MTDMCGVLLGCACMSSLLHGSFSICRQSLFSAIEYRMDSHVATVQLLGLVWF